MFNVIEPKRPRHNSWKHIDTIQSIDGGDIERWAHTSGLLVLTSVEAPEPHIGAEYHISVTNRGQRCTSNQAKFALKAFGMEHSDEDNHTLIARNYWQPVVDSKAEYVCPCKAKEPAIKLNKGDFIYRHEAATDGGAH